MKINMQILFGILIINLAFAAGYFTAMGAKKSETLPTVTTHEDGTQSWTWPSQFNYEQHIITNKGHMYMVIRRVSLAHLSNCPCGTNNLVH